MYTKFEKINNTFIVYCRSLACNDFYFLLQGMPPAHMMGGKPAGMGAPPMQHGMPHDPSAYGAHPMYQNSTYIDRSVCKLLDHGS